MQSSRTGSITKRQSITDGDMETALCCVSSQGLLRTDCIDYIWGKVCESEFCCLQLETVVVGWLTLIIFIIIIIIITIIIEIIGVWHRQSWPVAAGIMSMQYNAKYRWNETANSWTNFQWLRLHEVNIWFQVKIPVSETFRRTWIYLFIYYEGQTINLGFHLKQKKNTHLLNNSLISVQMWRANKNWQLDTRRHMPSAFVINTLP